RVDHRVLHSFPTRRSSDLPPLRERRKDLEVLARGFVRAYSDKHGRATKKLSADALWLLQAYDFPGNVRELANIIERAVIVSIGEDRKSTRLNSSHLVISYA